MRLIIAFNNKNWPLPALLVPDYLCFTANTAGSTIALTNSDGNTPNLSYSIDKENWTTWDYSVIRLNNIGDKIYFKGNNPNGIGSTEAKISKFTLTGSVEVSGNIMTLIDEIGATTTIPSSYCFRNLFRELNALTSVENLIFPATTITSYAYDNMFRGCSNLVYGPKELPATVLAEGCYRSFLSQCPKLRTTPTLKGIILTIECYSNMFGLSSLVNRIVTYASDISATDCLLGWLSVVSANGDFYNLGGANYPSGAGGIPTGWTVHTSL